jgi:hypothetical protein
MLRVGRMALEIPFLCLCVRFQVASFHEVGHDVLPLMLALTGFLVLGGAMPNSAFFAFTAAIPILSGLTVMAFLPIPHPLLSTFVSIYLGASIRRISGLCSSFFRGGCGQTTDSAGSGDILAVAVDIFIAVILEAVCIRVRRSILFSHLFVSVVERTFLFPKDLAITGRNWGLDHSGIVGLGVVLIHLFRFSVFVPFARRHESGIFLPL